ncbi:MAG: LamG-like jellyroll fold domain-containing protein, partial [Phycisphaerales bacterium]
MPLLPICAIWLVSVAIVPAQGGLDDGLVSYFKLDDGSGTTAVDSSGNGHHGTLVGTQTQWVEGYFDGGVLFATGEAEAHVEFPTTGMSVTAGTISVWGYLGDPQASRTRYFFGHTTRPPYGSRIQIYMDGGTTNLDLGLGDSHARRTDMMVLPTETWTHVVLTWDRGTYVVYVNGASIATGAYTGLTALDPVANISDDSNPSESEAFDGILDEARIYDRAITAAEVMEIFRTLPPSRINARSPKPEDKAVDVPRDTLLTWTASEFAAAHDVYCGTVLADVEAADRDNPMGTLAIEGQSTTAYQPPQPLAYDQTYYWRIDEVNAAPDSTIYKGDVWSFTVEPYSYALANITATASSATPNMGPEKTVDGSGLSADGQHSTESGDMWLSAKDAPQPAWIQFELDRAYKLDGMHVWNYNQALESFLGFGIKDVTIEYSLDCVTWTALGDFVLPQAPGDPTYTGDLVDLGGIIAKCVRLVIHSNWGGIAEQYGLSEVQFLHVPTRAWDLKNEGMGAEVVLTWRAGREAVSHRVYFSTDQQAVADGTAPVVTTEDNSLDLGTLQLGTTYYCRVDEVNEAAVPNVWESEVWSFTTSEFLVVDDLEGYTDDEGNRIYESWIDGMTNELSGS